MAESSLSDDTRYCKLLLFVKKCGNFVCKKYVLKCVPPDKNLDDYLKVLDNQKKSELKNLDTYQRRIVFPEKSTPTSTQPSTNLDQWDITLHSLILLDLFRDKLTADNITAIKALRDERHNLCHSPSTIRTKIQFWEQWDYISKVIFQLTKCLTTEDQEKVDDIRNDIIRIQYHDDAVEQLKRVERDEAIEDKVSERMKSVEKPPPAINTKVEDQTMSLGETWELNVSISGDGPFTVKVMKGDTELTGNDHIEISHTADCVTVKINKLTMDDSGSYHIDVSNDIGTDSCTLEMKVLEYRVMQLEAKAILKVESPNQKAAQTSLYNAAKRCVSDDDVDDNDDVSTSMKYLFSDMNENGVEIDKVEEGSFTFRCNSITGLQNINEYFAGEQLRERLTELENTLSERLQCSVKLNFSLTRETLNAAFTQIGKYNFRYLYLLVEIGTKVLRKLFDCKTGNDFGQYLATNPTASSTLTSLMRNRQIAVVLEQLLPPIKTNPVSSDFDITLLTCLLRSVCGLRRPNDPVWSNPMPTDTSVEATITRFKICRNNMAHSAIGLFLESDLNDKWIEIVGMVHSGTELFSEKDLNDKWTELTVILSDLNRHCGKDGIDDLSVLIEDASHIDIDEEMQNHFTENVKRYFENTQKIMSEGMKIREEEKMTKMHINVNRIKRPLEEQKTSFKQMKRNVDDGSANTDSPWAAKVLDPLMADELLKKNGLPNKSRLDLIIRQVGKKSHVANRICTAICKYLKNKYDDVLEAFAAFSDKKDFVQNIENIDEDCVIFVLLKKDDAKINCEEYRIYETQVGEIRPDMMDINRKISEFERINNIPPEKLKKLETCVRQQSSMLLKKHSNLTMVSASWCKSRGLGKLSFTPCVALYVPIKGLIPLDEDPFDSTIDEFSIDVREGVFEPFRGPTDYHERLKMGCEITSDKGNGTLGTFVILNKDEKKIFAITCAHVCLVDTELKRLILENDIPYGEMGQEIAHSMCEQSKGFGRLKFAAYSEGNTDTAGVDIALIEMYPKRIPEDGSFPEGTDAFENDFDDSYPCQFSSGMCYDIDSIRQSTDVFKYGSVSKLTKGKVRVKGTAVRNGEISGIMLGCRFVLLNQIEIESLGNEPFAQRGDSGSLVFVKSNDGLAAVGIFEGEIAGKFIVTPMKDILRRLKTCTNKDVKLLSFA